MLSRKRAAQALPAPSGYLAQAVLQSARVEPDEELGVAPPRRTAPAESDPQRGVIRPRPAVVVLANAGEGAVASASWPRSQPWAPCSTGPTCYASAAARQEIRPAARERRSSSTCCDSIHSRRGCRRPVHAETEGVGTEAAEPAGRFLASAPRPAASRGEDIGDPPGDGWRCRSQATPSPEQAVAASAGEPAAVEGVVRARRSPAGTASFHGANACGSGAGAAWPRAAIGRRQERVGLPECIQQRIRIASASHSRPAHRVSVSLSGLASPAPIARAPGPRRARAAPIRRRRLRPGPLPSPPRLGRRLASVPSRLLPQRLLPPHLPGRRRRSVSVSAVPRGAADRDPSWTRPARK